MIKLLAISLMCSCFGAPLMKNNSVDTQYQLKFDNRKDVVYVDSTYSINLSAYELVNYHWDNLANYINNDIGSDVNNLPEVDYSYNAQTFTYSELAVNDYLDFTLIVGGDEYYISLNLSEEEGCKFSYYGEEDYAFEYDLTINLNNANLYENYKSAIELDIEANLEEIMPSISDIFAEVTSAITSFVGSLGQAFNSVTALFYANGNWTFLGVLVLIGVGVGLVYGAYRLIKGLLHRV